MMDFSLSFPVTHVMHIGAGFGSEVDAYLAAGLAPIVLVEADRQAVEVLSNLARQASVIRVVEAAVSARSGEQYFHRCNFSDVSSLSAPQAALLEIFPGLEVLEKELVTTVAVIDLLKGCGLPKDGQGLLVIEAPGVVLEILLALEEAGWLERFPLLRLQEGLQPLHHEAPGVAGVITVLEKLGYDCWLEATPEDPDRPYLMAIRSAVTLQVHKAQAAAALQEEADRKTIAALEEAVKAGDARLEEAVKTGDARLEEAVKTGEIRLEEAQAAVERWGRAAQDAEQNLAIALRMQEMREADLRELQVRYGELLSRQEAQESLLRRMTMELSPMLATPSAKKQIGTAGNERKLAAKKAQKK